MDAETVLRALPPFKNKKVLIEKRQSVNDILKETLESHRFFEQDYNLIAPMFYGGSDLDILQRLFDFLKDNVSYVEETTENQQIKSPAAILETGHCDCKCYALFIGGVLDAMNRQGSDFDWWYAYASYNSAIKTPGHVFVIARVGGKDYWIDPVLSTFNKRVPAPVHLYGKKKVLDMALYRVSGVTDGAEKLPLLSKDLKLQGAAVGNVGTWIKENPVLTAGAVVALFLIFKKKK